LFGKKGRKVKTDSNGDLRKGRVMTTEVRKKEKRGDARTSLFKAEGGTRRSNL